MIESTFAIVVFILLIPTIGLLVAGGAIIYLINKKPDKPEKNNSIV